MSENRVIGKENSIPWHIPGELPRFKRITSGHPIIMGRKTFESIGRPLPQRLNIVITRDQAYTLEGAVVVHSLAEALEEAKLYYVAGSKYQENESKISLEPHPDPLLKGEGNDTFGEVFIIGGGQIFKDAMSLADKLYLTIIHKTIEGDTYFPEYPEFTKEVFREEHEHDGYRYTFLELER